MVEDTNSLCEHGEDISLRKPWKENPIVNNHDIVLQSDNGGVETQTSYLNDGRNISLISKVVCERTGEPPNKKSHPFLTQLCVGKMNHPPTRPYMRVNPTAHRVA